jgi:hypothetical protein
LEVENERFYPIKQGPTLKPKLLKIKYMSRPKFFYLGAPNSFNSKPPFFRCVWPPHEYFETRDTTVLQPFREFFSLKQTLAGS